MITNEHTEQSEREELIQKLLRRDHLISDEDRHKAAALLAADKAGGDEDDAVAYLRAEITAPKYRGWAICEDDDPNGFTVYRRPQPQPSALPAEVVKDAERWRKASTSRNHGIVDWTEFGQRTVYGKAAEQVIDAAMLKEGKNA